MIKKLNPKHGGKSNGFLNNYFEQNCSDINKGKDFCIKQVIRNVKKNDISQFYDLVGESLKAIGFKKVIVSREGDTNNRMDAIIVEKETSIPIKIKSPAEVEHINVKSIRQALENKIILLSRKFYSTKRDTSSLAIGFLYPNERSTVFELINNIYDTFKINIGLVDFETIISLRWDAEVDGKAFDLNRIRSLKGRLEC